MFAIVDVKDFTAVQSWVEATVQRYGKIDCAVNMAGILTKATPLVDLTEQDWDINFAVNAKGAFNCLKAQIRAMNPNGGGSIVSYVLSTMIKADSDSHQTSKQSDYLFYNPDSG